MLYKANITLQQLKRILSWSDILDAISNPISLHDIECNIIYMNKAMKEAFPEAKTGEKCYKIVHNTNAPPSFCPLQQSFSTRKPQSRIFFHDDLKREFLVNTYPIFSRNNELIGGIHIINDITEARQFQLKYEHQKSISDFIFEKAPFGIVFVQNQKIIKMNEAFEQICGYPKEELKRKGIKILFENRESFKRFYKIANHILRDGELFITEEIIKTKKGELVPIKVTCRKIKSLDSDINSYIWIIEDLKKQKELEETKNILTERLHRAQHLESLGILASGIAHDFNNILTPIMGYIELAQSFTDDDRIKKYLSTIATATARAKELIEKLLKFSKGQPGSIKKANITKSLKENVKLIRGIVPSSLIIKSKIEDIPYPVLCDPAQLNEIVMNLCTNAIHAMNEQGEIEIGCKLVELDEKQLRNWPNVKPGKYVKLWVSDTGCGMSQEVLERIFEPYFTTKGPDEGTGLGLAMVFNAVNSNNGFIDVKTEPGHGSTFYIYLPIVDEQELPAQTQCELCEDGDCLKGVKILLVDDEESVIMIAKEFLNLAGAEVKSFTDPEKALFFLKETKFTPDILVTDLTMPKLTGDQLAKKAREIIKNLPIVIITGWDNKKGKNIKEKFPIVKKPFKLKDLILTIKNTLEKNHKNSP